jgi:type VI secretion system protein ImpA
MPTPPTLDFASLVTKISEEQPAGPELRSTKDSHLFYAVRDARKKAVDAERSVRDFESRSEEEKKGEKKPERPDWETVRQASIAALKQSKDLWITAWLVEASTRLDSFAGLRDSVRLAHQLCEVFWQDIHPRPNPKDNEGPKTTFAQLAGLDGGSESDGTLTTPIMHLPLTSGKAAALSLADFKDASDLERRDPAVRARLVEEGACTIAIFNQSVAETDVNFFKTLIDDLEGAMEAFVGFNTFLKTREAEYRAAHADSEPFVPPSAKVRDLLSECLGLVKASTKELFTRSETSEGNAGQPGGQNDDGGDLPPAGSRIESREHAFRTLLQLSQYFRKTEPHSPISYALEQVVKWGRMSLPQLLSDLISDERSREEIFRRTGIQKGSDK